MVRKDEYLTPAQVADMLHIRDVTVTRYIREGRLKAAKVGNRWLVPRMAVEELLELVNVGEE